MKMFALSMTLNMPYVNNHSDVKHSEGKNEEVIGDGNETGEKIDQNEENWKWFVRIKIDISNQRS